MKTAISDIEMVSAHLDHEYTWIEHQCQMET